MSPPVRDSVPPEDRPTESFFRLADREPPASTPGLAPGDVVGDFRLVALLGQGGMGQVFEAAQLSLGNRPVALKFVRPERVTRHGLELFAREARAGGRMSHPGIAAVYGHGEADGSAWIAMELVPGGWTLRDFLDEMARADELPPGYDRQVARFAAEVADALQAAHEAGVIHRDLKPQNVLIGVDDRPKLVDFGLARITDESALSATGDFAGTYLYMSPEQVTARRMGLDHRSDVFSLGAVLYEMLTLRRPFDGDTAHQVAEQIVTKDPPDPRSIRSRIPRDLAVIAGKALEKDRDRRFASMADLAADLRRWLDDEPILARSPTRLDRAVKWCRRNPTKSVAAALVGAALVVISVLLARNVEANRALELSNAELLTERSNLARANDALQEKTDEALEHARRADLEARRATRKAEEVLRLSALQDLDDLLAEADGLWPARPALVPGFDDWIARARSLVADVPVHEAQRAALRERALPRTEEERLAERRSHPEHPRWLALEDEVAELRLALDAEPDGDERGRLAGELARREEERAVLDLRLDERRTWRFAPEEGEARWWETQLTKLLEGLSELERDLLAEDAVTARHGWSVPRRRAFAAEVEAESVSGPEARLRWVEAIESIMDPEECPPYAGLALRPQVGLLPIGRDPDSGLWEFAHLATGEPAERDDDGRLVPREETGVVLVLLPGGVFTMGAQATDPAGPNYEVEAVITESPVHVVTLSPFFLSKYELTQAQWLRLAGDNPSLYGPHNYAPIWNRAGNPASLLHPVERVSWGRSREVVERAGLALPSEAQWEYGARAGTSTPWWCGADVRDLSEVANVADAYGRSYGSSGWTSWDAEVEDGYTVHAPVGSLSANPFGLHDVHGNVWEWCLDGYDAGFYARATGTDPVRDPATCEARVSRGGSFFDAALLARSALRHSDTPEVAAFVLGLRPARALER